MSQLRFGSYVIRLRRHSARNRGCVSHLRPGIVAQRMYEERPHWIFTGQSSLVRGFPRSRSCETMPSLNFNASERCFCSSAGDGRFNHCWNCGSFYQSLPFLVCQSCESVQPVDQSVDYFQIFGLNKDYDIRTENLEEKHRYWQKRLHPDVVHWKSEKEKIYAAEQSARVIDAYNTLRKPLLRALYLLQLQGLCIDEEKTVSNMELLQEIMEIREDVDHAGDSGALKQIQLEVQCKLENVSNSINNAFQQRDFDSVKSYVERMTYYERAIEEIVNKL